MTRTRSAPLLVGTAAVLLAILVAGCGGGGGSTTHAAPATTARSRPAVRIVPATVAVTDKTKLGKILVDSRGRTLYLFSSDAGKASSCTGACAAAWPPLRSGSTPAVRGGASAALVGTIARSDGKPQATYHGHPLYTFVKDTRPGATNGEGLAAFGGSWFAVSPTGAAVRPPAPPPPPPPPPPVQPQPNPIPQGNGGDHDSDNNGGPSDGDGDV